MKIFLGYDRRIKEMIYSPDMPNAAACRRYLERRGYKFHHSECSNNVQKYSTLRYDFAQQLAYRKFIVYHHPIYSPATFTVEVEAYMKEKV